MGSGIMSQSQGADFAHLHLHSVYSLLDGAIRVNELVEHVKDQGMNSVAITDHGNMFAAVEFYDKAKEAGIKPIIGSEFYVAPGDRFTQRNEDGIADGNAYHMVLLAKNKTGYKNLIRMSSKAYTEGFYRKPRIDYELLAEHSEGVVGLTACLAGEVNRYLFTGRNREAFELAGKLNEILGQDNFYLEIQKHGIPEQEIAARGAVELHKKTGIPLVLTNDSHFLKKEDQIAQDILMRIQMNKKIDDPMEFGFNDQFYVKSPAEMKTLFPELPDAYYNTQRIADKVDLDFDFGHPLLPDFEIPDNLTPSMYLEQLSYEGLKKKFNGNIDNKLKERLKYELNVINNMGFAGYFLIVQDFIAYAKSRAIPVGPGRGSAAGSLVAYALGITNINPLNYDLLFERFLNPSRNEMPDIDIDFCRDRREEVINYVVEKYGEDHVSQIITFNTLSAKAVIKDVARVLGYDFASMNALSKHMPDTPGITLKEAVDKAPEVKKFFQENEQNKKLYQIAERLEGVPRNAGKHAAGVVIAPAPLYEIVPLAKDSKTGSVVTQFEKGPLEKVGLVKMDFLGLKNLTIIQMAVDEIERRHNIKLDIDNIPLDDEQAYKLLQRGDTKGVFQVEKTGITKLLMSARPEKFEDIVACIALYRPGPLQSGMADDYIKCKNGVKKVEYPHASLEPVLKDTFGTIVYQEQIMLISQVIGGFTMADADTLRKAMGKKKEKLMAKLKEQFCSGAVEKGHKAQWASDLYDMMAEFAKYGFNKSHSAAYGLITYQTAWLKSHYPVEFMKASLDADINTSEKLIPFIHACREMGIDILPPDINESNTNFTIIDDKTIRFGLLGLKGVGKVAVDAIIEARGNEPFKDMFNFAERVASVYFNKKLLEALVKSGALDNLRKQRSRAAVLQALESLISHNQKTQSDAALGQEQLFGAETVEVKLDLPDIEEFDDDKLLAQEYETLGLYLTSHPVLKYSDNFEYSKITNISEIDDGVSKEKRLTIAGVIETVKHENTKRGTSFVSLNISDTSGRTNVRVYSNLASQKTEMLKEGRVLLADLKVVAFREEESTTIMASATALHEITEIENRIEKSLHVYLPRSKEKSIGEIIAELKTEFIKHHGKSPVFLHYRDNGGIMQVARVHPIYYVNYKSSINRDLEKILGSNRNIAWRVGNQVHTNKGRANLRAAK